MADQENDRQSPAGPARKYMPTPDCREAPKFKKDDPANLLRFLKRYEDLLAQCGITDDKIKKETIGQYADAQTESEWMAFDSFRAGSWETFRQELISSYPEADDHAQGSVPKIEKVCKNNPRIGSGHLSALRKLKREFMAEAIKLTKVKPPVVSNRELVRMFNSCLERDFVGAIYDRLGIKTEPTSARRKDDRYDLDDIVRTAIEIAEGSAGRSTSEQNYVSESSSGLSPIKQEVDILQGDMATIKDQLKLQEKARKAEFESLVKILQQKTNVGAQATQSYNMAPAPQRFNNPMAPRDQPCFFCGESGHFIGECPKKKAFVEKGVIKQNEQGRFTLADGSPIRRGTGTWAAAIESATPSFAQNSQEYADALFQTEDDDYESDEITTVEQFNYMLDKLKEFAPYTKNSDQPKSILKRDTMVQGRSNKSEQGF